MTSDQLKLDTDQNLGRLLENRYQLQQLLAKTRDHRTYLAVDQFNQKQVVVKCLTFGDEFDWTDLKLFEREADLLRNLVHPAIPKYLDYFDVELTSSTRGVLKGFGLVQTYIPARSLAEQVQAGRTFTEAELKQLATDLLDILIYLQERAPVVIHRDIKPSNILLGDRSGNHLGQVYLIDFGAVQAPVEMGGTRTIVGTYGYMPPEQFGGRAVPASDLYSLGMTLVYLLTGQNPADLPQQDLQVQFTPLTQHQVSSGFSRWLQKMTHPALEKRFSSARQALKALQDPAQLGSSLVNAAEGVSAPLVQPANSQIRLTKTHDSLEILSAPGYKNPANIAGMVFLGGFAVAWNSFLIFWTGGALMMAPFPINLVFGLFSIPFWLVGLGMIAGIFSGLFGRSRLRFSNQNVYHTFEMFGINRKITPVSPQSDIDRIEFRASYFTKDSDGDRVTIPPNLILWAGTRRYNLNDAAKKGLGMGLVKPELEWLASELSQWLNLPVERTQNQD
jgi:serine/threonine protein kinase